MDKKSVLTNFLYSIVVLIGISFTSGCLNTVDFNEEATDLKFSLDTLRFDTVFTDRGTATRHFKVYNSSAKAIRTDISLGNETPFFRMNVDGIPGDEVLAVEILAHDSIYIFVEAIIDPHQPLEISPFVVEDHIKFNTLGREQRIYLEAYGQDAIYLTPDEYQGKQVYLSCEMNEITWEDERPFILNGILLIDSCTLNLAAGTRLYIHGGIQRQGETVYNDGAILIGKHGSLRLSGTRDNPVYVEGDRLETEFSNVAGQWNGIRAIEGSTGNIIEHTIIRNAIIGILVDSLSEMSINNSQIVNSAMSNLYGLTGNITASNSLFGNSGESSVFLSGGGNYSFTYVTMGNYGTGKNALWFSNLYQVEPNVYEYLPLQLEIRNSIVSANINDALIMRLLNGEYKDIDLEIKNTGIRSSDLTDEEHGFPDFYQHFNTAFQIDGGDPLFLNPVRAEYQLDSLSVARDKAIPLPGFQEDIVGNLRDAVHPSAGCYEYTY